MKCHVVILLFGLLFACSRDEHAAAPGSPRRDALATVGTAEITAADFAEQVQVRRPPDTAEARQALLEEMIDDEALVQAAIAAGIDRTPAYRRAMRDFLISRLKEEKLQPILASASNVSEEALAAAMPTAAAKFTRPPARRYAWIWLAEAPDAEERLKAVTGRVNELQADPSRQGFGGLAAELSEDGDTRYQGGDLGWFGVADFEDRFPPEVVAAANSLRLGEISDPIPVQSGLAIFLLAGERPALPMPHAEMRERLKYELAAEQRTAAIAEFERAAREAVPIRTDQDLLALQPMAPAAQPPAPADP